MISPLSSIEIFFLSLFALYVNISLQFEFVLFYFCLVHGSINLGKASFVPSS